MDVSVIIVNYNTRQMTAECIERIFEKTSGLSFEVILVDNASTDDSKAFFQNDTRLTYIYNTENLGFGRANNIGIAHAKGRNILLLNSDTLLINNAIKILSDYLDAHSGTGACGGNLFQKDLTPAQSFMRFFPSIFAEINIFLLDFPARMFYGRNKFFNHTGHPLDVAYIVGADLMIKRSVLDKTGTFNPLFFMYYEETELCRRIHRAGYRIQSVPQAEIIHLENRVANETTYSAKKLRMLHESRTLYYSLTHTKPYIRIANSIWNMTIHSRIFIFLWNPRRRDIWNAQLALRSGRQLL